MRYVTKRSSWSPAALALLGALAPPRAAAQGSDAHLLYVCSQDAAVVSVIDTRRNEVVETIDLQALGFPANAKPHHTVVERDGSFWYLSLIGANKVLKFDRDNRVVGQLDFVAPGMLALHPETDAMYVGRSMSAVNPPQRIGIIDRSTMTIDELDAFYPRPHALAVAPAGGFVLTASLAENQITIVDAATLELTTRAIDGGHQMLVQFAFSPDGSRLVAGGQMSGELLVFDATALPALRLVKRIPVNAEPWHPVFTPDGRSVYFGNKGANTVTVVDATTWEVAVVIEGEGLAEPHGSAVSPDGRFVYITSNNLKGVYTDSHGGHPGTVAVINTTTHRIEKVIEVPPGATGLSARLR
ncbi:MAG TPA: YncE family protein [Gemmatimonadales bacterium]